jgi:diadenosine tetraphosphate (Ap4A) HIT family hydrolase
MLRTLRYPMDAVKLLRGIAVQSSAFRGLKSSRGKASIIKPDMCPFCSIDLSRELISNEHAVAFADAFPVTEGHTLVVPRKHVASIYELCAEAQSAVWNLVGNVRKRLLEQLKPDGFNIGVNDGLAAGQTVAHAHVHIIPRRQGDVPDPRGGIRWIIADLAKYWD